MKTKSKKAPKPAKKATKPEKKLQTQEESAGELTEKEMAQVSGGTVRIYIRRT